MKILVTGSAGYLGEGLVRKLRRHHQVIGLDILSSGFTAEVGSITDRSVVHRAMRGVDAVIHAATLHKPHVVTHSRQAFVDVNVTGTLNLLEEAVAASVKAFVFISTTSAFGRALVPDAGEPAAWVTEDVKPMPKNIYGVTKLSAESLCELFHWQSGLPSIVLRTSRFFPEDDDDAGKRAAHVGENLTANEFLFRRVDVEDAVSACACAIERARRIGFGRYIVSATTPFTRADLAGLRADAPAVLARIAPGYAQEYTRRGWTMFPSIDRVYVNDRARADLGWTPKYDFFRVLEDLRADRPVGSELARTIGAKGYHATKYDDGLYPVDLPGECA